jgi:hypothetical protein
MSRRVEVGFSQRIQLDWLELTANLLLAGSTPSSELLFILAYYAILNLIAQYVIV